MGVGSKAEKLARVRHVVLVRAIGKVERGEPTDVRKKLGHSPHGGIGLNPETAGKHGVQDRKHGDMIVSRGS